MADNTRDFALTTAWDVYFTLYKIYAEQASMLGHNSMSWLHGQLDVLHALLMKTWLYDPSARKDFEDDDFRKGEDAQICS